jgi:hypothetical protein
MRDGITSKYIQPHHQSIQNIKFTFSLQSNQGTHKNCTIKLPLRKSQKPYPSLIVHLGQPASNYNAIKRRLNSSIILLLHSQQHRIRPEAIYDVKPTIKLLQFALFAAAQANALAISLH